MHRSAAFPQVALVNEFIGAGRLRAAARSTRVFGLHSVFPDIDRRALRASMQRLMVKRLWSVAAQIIGADRELQLELLHEASVMIS